MFSGSIPALVTPFRDGAFDEPAFRKLVDWQIEQGSSALVPCGTTGEASTLSNAEHHRVIEVCIEQAAGRVPVIAGCGSNDTMNALLHMNFSKKCGAAAALVVAPYYNRPSQAGLLAHFSYLAEKVDLPIVLYNVPGRTVTDIKPETTIELARRFPDRIVGIKDASGDMTRLTAHRLELGEGFAQICGNDDMALQYNAGGGTGCISVTANVAPRLCAEFQEATLAGNYAKALEYQDRLMPLHEAIFIEPGLVGAKYGLSRLGLCSEEVRLPLSGLLDTTKARIDAAMRHAGLIN